MFIFSGTDCILSCITAKVNLDTLVVVDLPYLTLNWELINAPEETKRWIALTDSQSMHPFHSLQQHRIKFFFSHYTSVYMLQNKSDAIHLSTF